jgi:hypothetical protein
VTPPPDRDPASTPSPPTGYATQFHSDPPAAQPSWQRALQRFQRWHQAVRLSLVATVLWFVGDLG